MRRHLRKIAWKKPNSVFAALLNAILAVLALIAVVLALRSPSKPPPESPKRIQLLPAAGDDELILTTTSGHRYYWNNEGPYPIDGFAARLSDWLHETHAPRVTVEAGPDANAADTARLVAELGKRGLASPPPSIAR